MRWAFPPRVGWPWSRRASTSPASGCCRRGADTGRGQPPPGRYVRVRGRSGGPQLLRRLADHAIARHYPDVADDENPYLAFFERVVDAQASLVARWMLVGFIHGVMNTDNMAISGETIDYGPCAFMDAYDPATVFSSIDHGGRYAYGNQPTIAQWNLARLAETLLPLLDDDADAAVAAATDVLQSFTDRFHRYWSAGMRAKLGLTEADGRPARCSTTC